MKQYIGKPGDDCCFFRCEYCNMSFLIEEEKRIHEMRCEAMQAQLLEIADKAEAIFEKIPNIEEQC